jgi:hypothetical protein
VCCILNWIFRICREWIHNGNSTPYLSVRENILKRQLAHVSAFNPSLILRKLLGQSATEAEKHSNKACFVDFPAAYLSESARERSKSPNDLSTPLNLHLSLLQTPMPDLLEIRCLQHGLLRLLVIAKIIHSRYRLLGCVRYNA